MKKIKNIKTKNQIEAVLAGISNGIIILDAYDNVLDFNENASRFLRISLLEKNKNFFEIIDNPEIKVPLEKIVKSKKEKIAINLEYKKYKYFLRIHVSNIITDKKKPVGRLITIIKNPISKKFRKLREDFVANVSHELKTPLTVIKGSVDTLLNGAMYNSEDAEHFVRVISKHTDRLDVLINDILNLSSIEQKINRDDIKLDNFNVEELLLGLVSLFEEKINEKKIDIKLDCKDDLEIEGDRQLIELAISNLIDNAIKYNNEGGYIKITAEKIDNTVLVSVKDSGIGIQQNHVSRLFERFYRVDKVKSRSIGGTGLGLSIVKQIVKAHKGLVTVKSEPDKGSTFVVILPAGK